ncbi:MAG: hypothetical protein ACHQK8_09415, partial [Bacteroidia bacterium]
RNLLLIFQEQREESPVNFRYTKIGICKKTAKVLINGLARPARLRHSGGNASDRFEPNKSHVQHI